MVDKLDKMLDAQASKCERLSKSQAALIRGELVREVLIYEINQNYPTENLTVNNREFYDKDGKFKWTLFNRKYRALCDIMFAKYSHDQARPHLQTLFTLNYFVEEAPYPMFGEYTARDVFEAINSHDLPGWAVDMFRETYEKWVQNEEAIANMLRGGLYSGTKLEANNN